MATDLDEALRHHRRRASESEAVSVGLVGNCAEVLPELVRRGIVPDVVTDQTSAHDPLNGYVPDRHDPRRSGDAAARTIRPNMSHRSMAFDGRARRSDARR